MLVISNLDRSVKSPKPGDIIIWTGYRHPSERPMLYMIVSLYTRLSEVEVTHSDDYEPEHEKIKTEWVNVLSIEDNIHLDIQIFNNRLNGYVRLSDCKT